MVSLVPFLVALILCAPADIVTAAESPTVVLKGERDSELAPHGQGNVYAPCVLREGALYRMWYGGQGKDGHDRIHYAESPDGLAWTRKGIVLQDPHANHVNDPSVLKFGGEYFMYYTRTEKDVVDRIDVAVSKDGITWEPKGIALAPGKQGAWDALSVGRPSVIYDGGIFRMWFDGRKDFPPGAPIRDVPTSSTSRRAVGYATSSDGLHFTRFGIDPVLGNNAGGVDVKRLGPGLLMVYESRDGTHMATGTNGTQWTDCGLLVAESGAAVDAFGHVTPCLLADPDGQIRRLYLGVASAASWDHNCIAMVKFPADRLQGSVKGPIACAGLLAKPSTTQASRSETIRIAEPSDLQVTLMTPANPSDHFPHATVKIYNAAAEDVIVGYEPGSVVVHCGGYEQHGPAVTFTLRREILRPRQPLEFELPSGGWMRSPTPGEQDLLLPLTLSTGKYRVWATFKLSGSTSLVESPHDVYVVP